MATFILDTGIVLGYLKEAGYAHYVEREYAVSSPPNMAIISVVTLGELHSIAIQRGWGERKRRELSEVVRVIPTVDISKDEIIEKYAEIDSYSQGKNPTRKLQGMSARNMGKNDIWIAATGSVVGARLLTNDHDFDHLNGAFLDVIYIDQHLR